ncbi:MAG TPA: AAA family ATPase, partial [Candidatus Kapabacteria bacterium]|nr:AAA family ATPase [Candidatus Kapabacteria bacterium]
MHTLRRFIIVGTSGSGKTTTARSISSRLGIPHIELDSLYHQPGWTHDTDEMFRAKVAQAISGESWVVDGNYSIVHDIVLPRAQVIVWLDHPFWRVMTQLVTRTVRRMYSREELWNGNKEELTKMFE